MIRYIWIFLIASLPLFANSNSYIIKVEGKSAVPNQIAKSFLDSKTLKEFKQRSDVSLSAKQSVNELENFYIVESENLSELKSNLESSDISYKIYENVIFQIEQTGVSIDGQWALSQVNAPEAWKYATGKGIVVGVVDTGLDYLHKNLRNSIWINSKEDLNGNGKFDAWSSEEEIDGVYGDLNGKDEDGNGYIDDVIGYDFVDQSVANVGDYRAIDPIPNDENHHGTKVSGVIAAQRVNGEGVQGLAFDSKLMALRAFDITGNGESDDIARAIVYAALNGVDVLNFSFGQSTKSPLVEAAVRFAFDMGVVIAASSGNSGSFYRHYPSDYDEVISVGGTADKGNLYGASNYGSRLDICAPGSLVYTTSVNNDYTETSGTSLAAPHISAALALLKEKYPEYSPKELKSVLMASAFDYKGDGWDIYTGAGFLDAAAALLEKSPSLIEITSPKFEGGIIKENYEKYQVEGTVLTPLFDSYSVYLGYGILPQEWFVINENAKEQIRDGILSEFNPSNFKDTTYTVRLVVKLKNGKTIEQRKFLDLISSDSKPAISDFRILNGYEEDRRVKLISITTNRPTIAELEIKSSLKSIIKIKDTDSETQNHLFVLDSLHDGDYNVIAELIDRAGNKVSKIEAFSVENYNMQKDKFVMKSYSTRMAYLSNVVADFANNEKPSIIINDGENLADDKTIAVVFDNNQFQPVDSTEIPWAVVGKGDSNGDGKVEFIATNYGKTSVFQESNGKYFSSPLFKSNEMYTMWAAGMYDFDNDGKDDIIMYNDTSYFVYQYANGEYKYKTTAVVPPRYLKVSIALGMAVADFDNDGKAELAHSDSYGRLYIHEYNGGKFSFEYIDTTAIFPNTVYMQKCDIDGDGTPEIVMGNYGSYSLNGKYDAGSNVWYYRIYKFSEGQGYQIIWEENFTEIRAGQIPRVNSFYKNGLSVGDIDNKKGEEFVISTFPNLYAFTWDALQKKIVPLWYYPSAYSVATVIYDFDKNGVNELGFSNFSRTVFYEYDSNYEGPDVPTGFEGWAISDTSAYLKWERAKNADYYKIYRIVRDSQSAKAVLTAVTDQMNVTIDTLQPNTSYEFVIQSVSLTLTDTESVLEDSDLVTVFTHQMIEPVFGVFTEKTLNVKYSGALALSGLNAFDFALFDSDGENNYKIQQVLSTSDSILIVTFFEDIPNGTYTFASGVFKDYYNSPSIEKSIELVKDLPFAEEEMYLKSLRVLSQGVLFVKFSHPIDDISALDVANYTLSPDGEISFAERDLTDSTQVMLALSSSKRLTAKGIDYLLTVRDVIAADGTPITKGAGNSLGFVITSEDTDEKAYVYPNPIAIGQRPDIYFAELPARCRIDVFRLDGEFVISIEEDDGNGGEKWDGKDINGTYITPGVYIYRITYQEAGSEEVTSTKKFLVKP